MHEGKNLLRMALAYGSIDLECPCLNVFFDMASV